MTWPVFRGRIAVPLEVRAAAMTTGAIVEIVLGMAAEGGSSGHIGSPRSAVRRRTGIGADPSKRRSADRGCARMSRGP
jgi:hypothetical protein